jgi:membrane-bound ClpP family serine protease
MMNTNKLPNDPTALVLGIVALGIIFIGCCCGLFAILSLALSIIALIMAVKSLNEYVRESESYSLASYKNMNAAKVIGIIGIALSSLVIFAQIAVFAISGEQFSKDFWEKIRENHGFNYEKDYNDSTDTWDEQYDIKIKKDGDSIYLDTITTETTTITKEQ